MNEPTTLIEWMKQQRAARDLTQEQLAEEIGCASQTVRMQVALGLVECS